ncbi:aminotransferase-like domain-containing protein [Paenibacillus pini]|uniref:Transcriptional regulator n=1 Tax=Paenibacillus pini JCM 16418 TaxID=1236976 RepID=W7Z0D5_9BACL|nr:PLP-dependent aminotransferase family protein [Paenibacillus pini]GAF10421.1 transcriptional regulator [Paenibacillus pini JCM 16418]
MNWKPQTEHSISIYKQIYYYFEEKIRSGELPSGSKMPTERDLAKHLSVNRSTVSTAYDELRSMGLIESQQGSGTRVSDNMWENANSRRPNWQHYNPQGVYDPTSKLHSTILNSFHRPHMINFTRGELSADLMPLRLLKQSAHQLDFDDPFSYFAGSGRDIQTRIQVSEFLSEANQIQSDPENILITSGVKHSLSLIARTLLAPGEAVAVEGPSYLYAMQVFAEAGIRMVKLPMDEHGLIPSALPELVRRFRIRMVFTNPTFQNPTGTSLSLTRRKQLLDICEQLSLPIVEDDPYSLLTLGDTQAIPSLKSLSGGERFVIYTGTMSKIATPGMRFGWIIAPEQVIEKLAMSKVRTGYSTSHLGERIAGDLLNSSDFSDHLLQVKHSLCSRRRRMLSCVEQELKGLAHILAPEAPAGGYYLWLKLKHQIPDKLLMEQAIKHGIVFYPSSIYGDGDGKLRLSYASSNESEIEDGVCRLSKLLHFIKG